MITDSQKVLSQFFVIRCVQKDIFSRVYEYVGVVSKWPSPYMFKVSFSSEMVMSVSMAKGAKG